MPQRFHGAHAGHANAVFRAGGEQRIEQVMRVLDGKVQLPAQRADEIHAQQVHIHRQSDFAHLAGEPREGRIVERHVGEFGQHLARARAGEHEAAAAHGDVAQLDARRRAAACCCR